MKLCDFAPLEFLFTLSGFVIAYVHFKDIGHPEKLAPFVAKRVARVYPAYWLLFPFLLIAVSVFPGVASPGKATFFNVISSFLLLPQPRAPLLGVMWSLPIELLFYTVFGLYIWRAAVGRIALFALATAGISSFILGLSNWPWDFVFSVHHLGCVSGCAVGMGFRLGWGPKHPKLWVSTSMGVMFLGAVFWGIKPGPVLRPYMQLLFIVCSAVMIAGLAQKDTLAAAKPDKVLVLLGSASYSIYLVHYPAMVVFAKLLASIHTPSAIFSLILFLVGVAAGVIYYLLLGERLYEVTAQYLTRSKKSAGGRPAPVRPEHVNQQ